MNFYSILYNKDESSTVEEKNNDPPLFFDDLNLDRIIDDITYTKNEYNLKPYFYTPLDSIDTILYRQEIVKDLENKILLENLKKFAKKMIQMRRYLALVDKLYYKYHIDGWYLEAINIYCDAVNDLAHDLTITDLKSSGLLSFREYLKNYINSITFTNLLSKTKKLKSDLNLIKYCIIIKGNTVKVRKYESEIDYSIEVLKTFERFKQGAAKNYMAKLPVNSGMNHIEAQILGLVAKLYPEIFNRLIEFHVKYNNFLDGKIVTFDREIQFFISYLDYISVLKESGLPFYYPEISDSKEGIYNDNGFDLALAYKLINEGKKVVCNYFYQSKIERILVISGPNQGGKTTFARMFGQLHYLASLGLPIPGKSGKLFLFDRIFTHFEKEEDIRNLRGKLQDDLVRIYSILNKATSNSIIIINEIFSSTTLKDAVFLGIKVMDEIIELDAICVFVTFLDELASLNEKTVSMVSTVLPENPAVRTYKIVRKQADGLVYALTLAEKYELTYNALKERIKV